MNDAVLIAVIGGVVAMYGVTIPLLVSARKHAKSANDQVKNSHTTNLRDDMDDNAEASRSRIARVERRVARIEGGIHRIENHLGIERPEPGRTNG